MRRRMDNGQARIGRAMTLIEMVMAMALLCIFFAVLLPQFRILHRSWELRGASAETLQNGRVLLDHLHARLSTARKITAVSGPEEPMGYLEFRDAEGQTRRYETQSDGWVAFGPVGSLSPLAGPVRRFRISGFAVEDLETAISDPAAMRLLRFEVAFVPPGDVGRDREFSFSVFLRSEDP